MGSTLGDWPSFDPHNFSQLRPSDPSNPSKMIPATYHPTHDRTLPPPDQGTLLVTLVTEAQALRLTIKGLKAILCDAGLEAYGCPPH